MATGHMLWQMMSHYGFVFLSVIGAIIVLAIVYRSRQKERNNR